MTRQTEIHFLSQLLYNEMVSKGITTDEVLTIYTDKPTKRVSEMTVSEIRLLDLKLLQAIFGLDKPWFNIDVEVPSYVKEQITVNVFQFLEGTINEPSDVSGIEKYYEIISVPTANTVYLLVLVREGIFKRLTETKEELYSFFLNLLSQQDKFDSNVDYLNNEYVSLGINPGHLDLVKIRLNR